MRINYKYLVIGGLVLNFMLAMSPSQAAKQRMVCPSDGKRPMFNTICPGGDEPIPIEEYENKSRPPQGYPNPPPVVKEPKRGPVNCDTSRRPEGGENPCPPKNVPSVTSVTTTQTLIQVFPSQLSGKATFFHTESINGFSAPVPYGYSNNTNDYGWIWNPGGFFIVDFQKGQAIDRFRIYSVYADGPRGATLQISYSDDGSTFTNIANLNYRTRNGGGINDDGTTRSDFAGWYSVDFNAMESVHRYWKIQNIGTITGVNPGWDHAPRSGQIEFYGPNWR